MLWPDTEVQTLQRGWILAQNLLPGEELAGGAVVDTLERVPYRSDMLCIRTAQAKLYLPPTASILIQTGCFGVHRVKQLQVRDITPTNKLSAPGSREFSDLEGHIVTSVDTVCYEGSVFAVELTPGPNGALIYTRLGAIVL